ncbi:MAG: VOC family protein [Proteobacteria bacterium]|nr:VOC family protein [Pseudomonadota bacterium]
MRRHLRGIDHVVVLVRDLDRAQQTYARMGFTLTPRGFHTLGSQNHCLMFGSDYVELLAVPRPHPALQYFTDFLAKGEGLGAIALATDDAGGLHAGLAADGIAADAPLDFSRPVEGLGEARFRIVQLPPQESPGCRMFACQHFSRDIVWRPAYQRHANGATEIAAVAVVAEFPESAAACYGRVMAATPQRIEEVFLVQTGSAPIALATRWKLGHRLHGVGLPLRPRPQIAALFVRVADRAATAALLRRNGLQAARLRDGSFAVSAQDAHGVAVIFG